MVHSEKDAEAREVHRTNTMLAATASVGRSSWEVKIRNISALGAMVETPVRPSVKSSITLKRGSAFAAGEVIWTNNRAAGIKFFEQIDKSPWLSVPIHEAIEPTATSDIECTPSESQTACEFDDVILNRRVAEEIAYVARVVKATATLLAEDPILRIRYCSKMQELSMAVDELNSLGAVIISDNKEEAIRSSVPGAMRQRLLR